MGYVVLLAVVPVLFPPDPSLPNVAARSGYSTNVAYLTVAGWSVLGLAYFALTGRRATPSGPPPAADATLDAAPDAASDTTRDAPPGFRPWLEASVVGAAVVAVYWPPFLARYAHYSEDSYFMDMLARMDCGQLPYRDFEFLYGPLMIYPAHAWLQATGFSATSYYAFVATLQALLFVAIVWLFRRHLPDPRERYLALACFAIFVCDSLLGMNYIGWRVMLVLFAIVVAAARPYSLAAGALAGSLVGVQLTYSFDHGAVAAIAVSLMYGAAIVERRQRDAVRAAGAMLASFLVVAVMGFLALTAGAVTESVQAIAETFRHANAAGVGNFRFYWTLNSLCLFGLLGIAVVTVGKGLWHIPRAVMTYGDRLWLGTLLFALGSLRVALQRADIWHLTLPFIPLIAVCLWRPAGRVFTLSARAHTWIWILVIGAAVTRAVGLAPTASHFLRGWARGAIDVVTGAPTPAATIETRRYSLQSELSHPDPVRLELARFLASDAHRDRPVVFYSDMWWLGLHTGVCPSGYSFFQLMYTDAHRPMTTTLEADPTTLVVMEDVTFQRLFAGGPVDAKPFPLTPTQRLGSWVASIHHVQRPLEARINDEVWKQNLGDYLLQHYSPTRRFGDVVVLERSAASMAAR